MLLLRREGEAPTISRAVADIVSGVDTARTRSVAINDVVLVTQRPGSITWRSHSSFWNASDFGSRVLIVDDDVNLLRLLRTILRTAGFEVLTADSAATALSVTASDNVDCIVLDLRM